MDDKVQKPADFGLKLVLSHGESPFGTFTYMTKILKGNPGGKYFFNARPGNEREILSALANDNLYKDIFKWENIKKPLVFEKLVKALAMQIGSSVSINELSNLCAADNKTIGRYIRLLEQSINSINRENFHEALV
ncbi:hypothetical protein AGMMS49944_25000 [Spirochaetia bacterium]|nr:hypothetical protein AGMMS49944_25000 [Spirochaetia bacterium]